MEQNTAIDQTLPTTETTECERSPTNLHQPNSHSEFGNATAQDHNGTFTNELQSDKTHEANVQNSPLQSTTDEASQVKNDVSSSVDAIALSSTIPLSAPALPLDASATPNAGGEEVLPPVIASRSDSGRCLVATQPFSAGDVVFEDIPMVTVVADSSEFSFCHHCFAKLDNPGPTCSICNSAAFCSMECAEEHNHGLIECPAYQKILQEGRGNSIGYACRMMIRILQNFANTTEKEKLEKFYQFMQFESHADKIAHSPWAEHYRRRCEAVAGIVELKQIASPLLPQISHPMGGLERMLFEIMCRIHCNAFAVKNDHGMDCGNSIFLKGALLNHSCAPNCKIDPTIYRVRVIATKNILPNQELTISYTVERDAEKRRRFLERNYFFSCQCDMCKATMK